jgi:hypothetical protein
VKETAGASRCDAHEFGKLLRRNADRIGHFTGAAWCRCRVQAARAPLSRNELNKFWSDGVGHDDVR